MIPRPVKNKKEQSSSDSQSSEAAAGGVGIGSGNDGGRNGNDGTIFSLRNNTSSAVQIAIDRTMAYRRRTQSCCWLFTSICATWRYAQLL